MSAGTSVTRPEVHYYKVIRTFGRVTKVSERKGKPISKKKEVSIYDKLYFRPGRKRVYHRDAVLSLFRRVSWQTAFPGGDIQTQGKTESQSDTRNQGEGGTTSMTDRDRMIDDIILAFASLPVVCVHRIG